MSLLRFHLLHHSAYKTSVFAFLLLIITVLHTDPMVVLDVAAETSTSDLRTRIHLLHQRTTPAHLVVLKHNNCLVLGTHTLWSECSQTQRVLQEPTAHCILQSTFLAAFCRAPGRQLQRPITPTAIVTFSPLPTNRSAPTHRLTVIWLQSLCHQSWADQMVYALVPIAKNLTLAASMSAREKKRGKPSRKNLAAR
ncbi:hypothetical protein GGI42DRAFT_355903 [Trichoderma sp. SZMC 28013]